MRRCGVANAVLNQARWIHIAHIAGRLVAICKESPTGAMKLSDLSSASHWSSLNQSGLSKSLKKFLNTTYALAVFQHGADAYAAIPRSHAFTLDFECVVGIIEAARGSFHVVLDEQTKLRCLNVAWLLRSEILVDLADGTFSASLGQRQILQQKFVHEATPSNEYLSSCGYPLLNILRDVTDKIPSDLLERLLCWPSQWPSLKVVFSLEIVDGFILLRPRGVVPKALPDTFEDALILERGNIVNSLAVSSLAVEVIFDKIIPAISTTTTLISTLDHSIDWGRVRYTLGTLQCFLRHFHGVFFHVDEEFVALVPRHSVTVVHIVARLILPIFNLQSPTVSLPALYATTRWSSLFQPWFGPLQSALSATGMQFAQLEGGTIVSLPAPPQTLNLSPIQLETKTTTFCTTTGSTYDKLIRWSKQRSLLTMTTPFH